MKGEFNFDLHALKRIDYIGVTFRTRIAWMRCARSSRRPAPTCGRPSRRASSALPIDQHLPARQAAEALAHMKANAHFGKIVLVV